LSKPNRPEAILFDLDDTILDTSSGIEELWQNLCQRYAVYLAGVDGDVLLEAVNKFRKWYWDDPERHRQGRLDLISTRSEIISMAIRSLGIDNPAISKQIAVSYTVEREGLISLFPGAIDTLIEFRNIGIKLALVTNGASIVQRNKIERFNLTQLFDCITIEGEFGAGKPDESVFIHTLKLLGTSCEKAWMVGDDLLRDIQGAQKAGIYSIWNDWNKTGLQKESSIYPDRIINSIAELI
jgi:putative hydrolase of the HAD superfamily